MAQGGGAVVGECQLDPSVADTIEGLALVGEKDGRAQPPRAAEEHDSKGEDSRQAGAQ